MTRTEVRCYSPGGAHESDRHGFRGPRHPFPDLGTTGRLGRHEPRSRLLGRLRRPAYRCPRPRGRTGERQWRRRGTWLLLHHRARQRGDGRRHRGPAPLPGGAPGAPYRGRSRRTAPRTHPRLATALARPGEGRDAHGGRRGRQRRLGPGGQARGQARLGVPRRDDARGARLPRRLPLPQRRPHPRRGAGDPAGRRTGPGRARRTAARRGVPGVHHLARLAGLQRRQAGQAGQGGRRRRLHPDQAEGRRQPPGRRPQNGPGPRRRRTRHPDRRRRQPALGRPGRGRVDDRARAVRPALDRGAHQPRRHPRPRRRPGRSAGQGRHRRTRRQPGRVQAAAPGRGRRLRPDRRGPGRGRQREPGDPAARREVRRTGLPARGRGRTLRAGAAPLDVRLRGGLRQLGQPRDRVRRPSPRALRRPHRDRGRPLHRAGLPGFSARMLPASIAAHRYPEGAVWQARRTEEANR